MKTKVYSFRASENFLAKGVNIKQALYYKGFYDAFATAAIIVGVVMFTRWILKPRTVNIEDEDF